MLGTLASAQKFICQREFGMHASSLKRIRPSTHALNSSVAFPSSGLTRSLVQVLVRRETFALLTLLRKLFAVALNIFNGAPQEVQSLVRAAWELLRRIIHEDGPRAKSPAVSLKLSLAC